MTKNAKLTGYTATQLREMTWEALVLKDPGIDTLYREVLNAILKAVEKGEYITSLSSHITNLKKMEAVLYRLQGMELGGFIERNHADQSITITLAWGNV